MPVFHIELEDGRKFEVDAEDQASALQAIPHVDKYHQKARDLINSQAAKGRDISGGFLDKYLQGATLGFGDEAVAAGRTALGAVVDPIKHIGDPAYQSIGLKERYNYEKALEDERAKDATRKTGAFGTALEMAAGLGTGVGAGKAGLTMLKEGMSLPKLMAAGSAEGAGYGAIAGAGEGDGVSDRFNRALKGGAAGAALGAGIPAVGAGIGAVAAKPLSRIMSAADPKMAATARLQEDLQASGMSAADVLQKVKDANAAGIPMTVADVMGKEGQRRLYTAASANGPGRDFATNFLNTRQEGQMGRVTNMVEQAMGADRTARQAGQDFMSQARTRSKPLYDAIPEYPEQITPRVSALLDEPLMQQALKEGMQIQRNNALAAGEDLAGYTVGEAKRANNAGLNAFNFKNYQAMKIGLDNMLEKYRNPQTGNLDLTPEGRSIVNLRKALDTDLKDMFPGYGAADAAYAGPASVDQAIGLGKQLATSGRSRDNIETFNALNDAQKVGARIGYADKKLSSFRNATEGANVANRLLSPEIRAEMEALSNFTGPQKPGADPELTRRLRMEKTMSETRNTALGGSRTAENLADQANNGIDPRLMSAVSRLIHGDVKGALNSGGELISTIGGGNTPAVREEIAKTYLSNGDVNIAALLRKASMQSKKAKRKYTNALQGLLSGSAIAGGLMQ